MSQLNLPDCSDIEGWTGPGDNTEWCHCAGGMYDSGDTGFMILTAAFVMLQTPAMGIAQAGMIRRKNALVIYIYIYIYTGIYIYIIYLHIYRYICKVRAINVVSRIFFYIRLYCGQVCVCVCVCVCNPFFFFF